jgi:hypothetical protein
MQSEDKKVYQIIFSSYVENKQNDNNITKNYYFCYACKFYEEYRINKEGKKIFIQKALCIVSQYPYFSVFQYICINIIRKKVLNLPIEFLIYNIVNFIPSPIKDNYNMDICKQKDAKIPLKFIKQLTGYPIIDFNLLEIFKIFPVNIIIIIFILIFLEQDIMFFSSSVQLLYGVVYIFNCLNFPFNNNSYHNYINSEQNYNFNEKLYKFYFFKKNNLRNKETFISIDIDNQKYNISPVEGNKDLYKLVVYIAQLLEGNNQNYLLNQIILNFREKINKNITPSIYLKDHDDKINFFETNNEINIIIQEIFYDFCLNLFLLFYYDNIYSSEDNKIKDNSKKK